MRVILMHNPSAGAEDHGADDLVDEIERHGHHVIDHVCRSKDLARALRRRCDVVAVAGGDGTVGKAARVLAGTGVPFTILPLGTANNLALTLRASGETADLVEGWSRAVVANFDLAVAAMPGRTVRFLEGLGFGVFPRAMRRADRLSVPDEPEETLARDVRVLRETIERARPRPYVLSVDGEDLSGDYLMVELMNIPYLGPNLEIAPGALPGDGRLDVVTAGEVDRAALLHAVDELEEGRRSPFTLPVRRATRVDIARGRRRFRRDGDLCDGGRRLRVSVEPAALRVLVPR